MFRLLSTLTCLVLVASCAAAETRPGPVTSVGGGEASATSLVSSSPGSSDGASDASFDAAPETSSQSQATIRRVVIVGDSIARQISAAATVIAPVDVAVAYLVSVGPAFAGDAWPSPLYEFVPEPATTAVIVSFGTWQSAPPPHVEDQLFALEEQALQAEIEAYLEPMVGLGLPNGPALWLRPSVDAVEANELLRQANALIEPIAIRLGVRTHYVLDGLDDVVGGRPAVRIEGVPYPVRNDDATHYCPAPALVIARDALIAEGIDVDPPTGLSVARLITETDGLGLFQTEGCEPLTAD